jgi:CubicO group peptidase (beta-lactamase class C family)
VIGALSLFGQPPSVVRLDSRKISPSEIDAAVVQLMERAHVTGVGIAVLNDGKVVYLKAYGVRDKEKHLPLTPDSVMTAASLTKPAFATMVMRLVDERIIELDKPVYEYLPKPLPEYDAYKDLADDHRYKQITMRMLLDHTSGFPNWRWLIDDKKLRIYFTPGSRFAYSGEGIDLAQMVVETVTKKSISELMNEYLFQPLGMTRTGMTSCSGDHRTSRCDPLH